MEWAEGIACRRPIVYGGREHPRVFVLTYDDGRPPLLLKISKSDAAAKREALALRLLYETEAPVPRLISDDVPGVLVMELLPGTPLGAVKEWPQQAASGFWQAWTQLKDAWGDIQGKLEAASDAVNVSDFRTSALGLASEMARIHPDPPQVRHVWEQIVDLALSSSLAWGSLDYNPYNVLQDTTETPPRFRFVDFESFGWDWDERRLWQLTTQFRSSDGGFVWRPFLQASFGAAPAAAAHYLVFAAFALQRVFGQRLTVVECRRLFGAVNSTSAVASAWCSLWH